LLDIHEPKKSVAVVNAAHCNFEHRLRQFAGLRVTSLTRLKFVGTPDLLSLAFEYTASGFVNSGFASSRPDRLRQNSPHCTPHEKSVLTRADELVHGQREDEIDQVLI